MEEWIYNDQPITAIPANAEAFVYLIENLTNGRLYVGKKQFWFRRKKNGPKRRVKMESDWRKYTSSSESLNDDIAKGHQIRRRILHLHKTAGSANYYERYELFSRNVLTAIREDGSYAYYNKDIGGKWRAGKIRPLSLTTPT